MDTNVFPNNQCCIEDNNLELFSIIWFDSNLNIDDSRKTDEKLRHIINHLKKFQDIEQCQQYIEQRSEEDRLVIIVSGTQGQQMVPHIHHLGQVSSIYVYCMDQYKNQQWACEFSKVKFTKLEKQFI